MSTEAQENYYDVDPYEYEPKKSYRKIGDIKLFEDGKRYEFTESEEWVEV